MCDGSSIFHVKKYAWGKEDITNIFAETFAVSQEVTEGLFHMFLERRASPHVMRTFEKLVGDTFENLAKPLQETLKKYDIEQIYIAASFELPPIVFSSHMKRALNRRIRILPCEEEKFGEQFGFSIQREGENLKNISEEILTPFLDFYFLPRDDKMNQVAKRHARWLSV